LRDNDNAPIRLQPSRSDPVNDTVKFLLDESGIPQCGCPAYIDYPGGKLVARSYDETELAMALAGLPSVPA